MQRITCHADLEYAVSQIVTRERRFQAVVDMHGLPPLRHMEPGPETLLRIVTDQLISLKSGEAIWKRVKARLGGFRPEEILACDEAELRQLGLSGAKARTFLAVARFDAETGLFGPLSQTGSDEDIAHALLSIPGIGPWTVQIYLLSAVKTADAWPSADLALQVAAMDLFSLEERPSGKKLAELSTSWRPYRAAAARLLWSHYRGLKQMPQVPI
jgi:DNA-3-methyladenine glycosylase II